MIFSKKISIYLKNFPVQDSPFQGVFAVNPTIVFASMVAFLCGQFLDITCFQKIRKLTQNRLMWLRNNVSTMLSQLVDTIIISGLILFYGLRVDFLQGIEIMMASYLFKVMASIMTMPLFYGLVFFLKRLVASESTDSN